jgi:DNA mismatch endonuclease (patch repair protein)
MDTLGREERSRRMALVRSSGTKPELVVWSRLDKRMYRYQPSGIAGNPDFANRSKRIAVFLDGCFWHGCPTCYRAPKSNVAYWIPKVQRNSRRDKRVGHILRIGGWRVLRFWECQVRTDADGVAACMMEAVSVAS